MSDTRRKAAEEWADGAQESEGLDAPAYCDAEGCLDDGILYALENAHLAGQEHREREVVEGIVRRLRGLAHGMARNLGRSDESIAKLFLAARSIERGEWKEGK